MTQAQAVAEQLRLIVHGRLQRRARREAAIASVIVGAVVGLLLAIGIWRTM